MWKTDGGSLAGTTTASYASALDWKTGELGQKTILLRNTDGSSSLKYKLLGYVRGGAIGKELVAETTLEAGETAELHYGRHWGRLLLQVINGSGVATYAVEYEGQGA